MDGLTLFDGAQLAIDTTLVSPLNPDGTARRRAADHNGAALEDARRKKERTYPELAVDVPEQSGPLVDRGKLVPTSPRSWTDCGVASADSGTNTNLRDGRARAAAGLGTVNGDS